MSTADLSHISDDALRAEALRRIRVLLDYADSWRIADVGRVLVTVYEAACHNQ